ncbi:hypothetical protein ACN20G_25545 [Streptomyces sp. BI20]|uniref:hypothetical protein n=1 Tax=Streptomyces sp. BI20 TaxID=3403460 RepID=UPI003C73D555
MGGGRITRTRAERARDAVAGLLALAERDPDGVVLLPGHDDELLDTWPGTVPEAVRIVLRACGGLRAGRVDLAFGPRRRSDGRLLAPSFAHGYCALGEPWGEEGRLLVGVGEPGDPRPDWGPVLTVRPYEDGEVIVEAPEFVGWLADLVDRLTEDPKAPVRAVPYADLPPGPPARSAVAVAEGEDGADAELRALVGRGDQLVDVVDLRAATAHPCRTPWEPYQSTEYDTADTGASEVHLTLAGEGRALLLRSEVSGDYLGRPVRRHRLPADAAVRAVAELTALAAERPALVSLEPGLDAAELAAVEAVVGPLPEEVAGLLRALGGFTASGLPPFRFRAGVPEHAVDPEVCRMMGGEGGHWPIARVDYGRYHALAQVRVDPDTGAWGPVVSLPTGPRELSEFPELVFLGACLPELLLTLARVLREAAESDPDAPGRRVARETGWLFPNTGEPWPRPVPLSEWAGSEDPERAALAAALPPGTHAADLSEAPVPADLCFHRAADWPWGPRLDRIGFAAGGRIAYAVPRG